MANSDINTAIIEYLQTCPYLQNIKVYFNFAQATDNIKQLVTVAQPTSTVKTFIDGSKEKIYSITIIDYRSVAYQPLVNAEGDYPNENVEEFLDVQGIIEWIEEQDDLRNFPELGDDYVVDKVSTTTDIPNLNGVDTSIQPTLAKYSVTIQVQYLDKSKVVWR